MKTLYTLLFLVISLAVQAQPKEQYYDWRWRPTDLAHARFLAVTEQKGSLWHRQDFFTHENCLQMSGTYKDSAGKVAHGLFKYYHPNRRPQHLGEYVDGKREGIWVSYHANGMMSDSGLYKNGNITGTSFQWHSNGYLRDSAVYNDDGSGISISWFDNGNPASAGRYAAGYKKIGKWQYFHKNGNKSAVETYDHDVLVDKQYFDEAGNAISDTTSQDREASFKGGKVGWQKFIIKQLYFPDQFKIVNADDAVVVVDGVVDEEGNMTDVQVSTPFYPEFDKIAVNAIKASPKWTPAIQHNRKVKYAIRQAVTFTQE